MIYGNYIHKVFNLLIKHAMNNNRYNVTLCSNNLQLISFTVKNWWLSDSLDMSYIISEYFSNLLGIQSLSIPS